MAKKHSTDRNTERSEHLRELAILADAPFEIAALVAGALALLNEGRTADKTPTGFAVRMLLRATDELEQLALDMGNMLLS
jgi:hypothetical protein